MSEKVDRFLESKGIIVSSELKHYASKYYDPVKAREYYLRTRELKGREPALSKESRQRQREATDYVRNEINTRKKTELDANKAQRLKLQKQAEANRAAYVARIKKMQKAAETTRKNIMKKLENRLKTIGTELKIPTNASPKLRAFLEKQHAQRTASAKEKVRAEAREMQEGIRDAFSRARDQYNAARTANADQRRKLTDGRRKITEKYRNDLNSEKRNIKDQVR